MSRLVAQEIKRGPSDNVFAATPPLEAKKHQFSMAITQVARGQAHAIKGSQKLLFMNVRRAYFYSPARKTVYVTLPDGDAEESVCGKLNPQHVWNHKCCGELGRQVFLSSPINGFLYRQSIAMCILPSTSGSAMCSTRGRLHIPWMRK